MYDLLTDSISILFFDRSGIVTQLVYSVFYIKNKYNFNHTCIYL